MTAGEIIAIAAAVISLGAACAAWIRARRAEYLSASTGTTGLLLNVNRALVDYPDTWPYFSRTVACPGDHEHDRVRALALLFLNVLEAIQAEKPSLSRDDRAAWSKYLSDVFAMSPVMLHSYVTHPYWYPNLQRGLPPDVQKRVAVEAEKLRG
jgi:hypothetical protein